MAYYDATIDQLEKILSVRTLDRTPQLVILLDNSDEEKLCAQLARISELINNTTRYISDIAFANLNGGHFGGPSNTESTKMLATVYESIRKKTLLQISVEEKVKTQPYGPYFDFFRSKETPHNQFGQAFPLSEIADLTLSSVPNDKNLKHLYVNCKTESLNNFKRK